MREYIPRNRVISGYQEEPPWDYNHENVMRSISIFEDVFSQFVRTLIETWHRIRLKPSGSLAGEFG